ncbi:MAG TPA: hypothetical protein DCX53_14025 [Anaerolineae bacterium]|nr:hypothetical protein [Anaerolineae bacterium]
MPIYEITNSLANNVNLRTGPSVLYGINGSLAPGLKGKGDFIMTYQNALTTADGKHADPGDEWVHVTELNGTVIDGWMAIKHLGVSYAQTSEIVASQLEVNFGVELEGYQPITLTGMLKPK